MHTAKIVLSDGSGTSRGTVILKASASHRLGRNPRTELVRRVVWFVTLGLASYVIASHYIFEYVKVVGPSMKPTLQDSDSRLLDCFTYLWRAPERGEIVVIVDPADAKLSVKRIVGLPGEVLSFRDGRVLINDQVLDEPYLPQKDKTAWGQNLTEKRVACGKGEFFVLGDNRANSADSRNYGPVRREDILGLLKF